MGLSSIRRFVVGAALAGAIGMGGAMGVIAQDSTPASGHPAHIHEGTCAELDPNPAVGLFNLLPLGVERDDDGEVAETPERRGTLSAAEVVYSETDDIQFGWDAMLASPHAIVVHESEDYMENYIACGDIGGVVYDDDGNEMVIGLHPVGDSGYSGLAVLNEDGDSEVDVEVYLVGTVTDTAEDDSTVVATPEG